MRAAFYTLGCKVNQYETSVLTDQFAAGGFSIVEPEEEADVYVLNSCTVTAASDRKSRQLLRRFRRQNPEAVVVLCGCFPQAFPREAEAIPEADVIVGAKDRVGLLDQVLRRLESGERIVRIAPHEKGEPFEPMRASSLHCRTRAFVKIQDGCQRRCAYCIIPAARGPVRSKPPEDIRRELEGLAAAGYREVVLVGINLSCYGQDCGLRLTDAVRLACSVPGIDRVRLGSLEPELLRDEDIARLAALPPLCDQFHLSLQSGCDATLARMRRHYGTAEYRRIVCSLREAFPGCAVTTDMMAGFPGETAEEFSRSLDFLREIGFARVHVFAYSRRASTAAAEMPGQIPQREKNERAAALARAAEQCRQDFFRSQIGRTAEVLFETHTPEGWEGYSTNYTPVWVRDSGELAGQIRAVRITGAEGEYCTGILAE